MQGYFLAFTICVIIAGCLAIVGTVCGIISVFLPKEKAEKLNEATTDMMVFCFSVSMMTFFVILYGAGIEVGKVSS